jgi:hypothetical protein
VNRELAQQVRERAAECCEYCRIPQFALPLPFQIDHIIAEKHQGQTEFLNLALACPHCNRYKGPNIAGNDPDTGQLVRLYHPRHDEWADHFDFHGASIFGKTPIGRTTVQVLSMNAEGPLRLRKFLPPELFRGS